MLAHMLKPIPIKTKFIYYTNKKTKHFFIANCVSVSMKQCRLSNVKTFTLYIC